MKVSTTSRTPRAPRSSRTTRKSVRMHGNTLRTSRLSSESSLFVSVVAVTSRGAVADTWPLAKLVQANRAAQGGAPGLSRAATSASTSSAGSYGSRTAPPPSRSATVGSAFKKAPPPPPPSSSYSAAPPPYSPAASSSSVASAAGKRAPPPPPPLKPKPKPPVPQAVYVSAVYDFEAQAEGDLSFRAGDRIELVKKTDSQEDWWTGRLNGQEGVFPGGSSLFWTWGDRKSNKGVLGNYVQL